MQYGYVTDPEAYLAHHGIKGQKWGTRNGPPYPLKPTDHSPKEKKLNNGRYSQGVKQNRKDDTDKKEKSSGMTQEEKDAKVEQYKNTAKKVAKGVGIAAAIGTAVTAATATTAAVAATAGMAVAGTGIAKHISKNPYATKQALKNIGSATIGALNSMSERARINRTLHGEDRISALNILKNTDKANKMDRQGLLQGAKLKDTMHQHFKENKKKFEQNERNKALDALVTNQDFQKDVFQNPHKFTSEVQAAATRKGVDKTFTQGIENADHAKKVSRQKQQEYRDTHGVRGKVNKTINTYDTVLNVGSNMLNRVNKSKDLIAGIGATTGLSAYAYNKKKEKEREKQREYQQYYYR